MEFLARLDPAATWAAWMWGQFWQVLILTLVIVMVDISIRRARWPHLRLGLWSLVLIKLLIPPSFVASWSATSSWFDHNGVPFIVQALADEAPASVRAVASHPRSAEFFATHPLVNTAFTIWLGGFLLLSAIYLLRYVRCARALRRDRDKGAPAWLSEVVRHAARDMRLRRVPPIVISRLSRSPAVFGFLRPVILVPPAWTDISREDAKHIIRHEIAHLVRNDLMVNVLSTLLAMCYWFVPMVYFVRSRIATLREICCDADVVAFAADAHSYRETLIRTARIMFGTEAAPQSQPVVNLIDDAAHFRTRLRALKGGSDPFFAAKRLLTPIVLFAIALFILPMGRPELPAPCEHNGCQRSAVIEDAPMSAASETIKP